MPVGDSGALRRRRLIYRKLKAGSSSVLSSRTVNLVAAHLKDALKEIDRFFGELRKNTDIIRNGHSAA